MTASSGRPPASASRSTAGAAASSSSSPAAACCGLPRPGHRRRARGRRHRRRHARPRRAGAAAVRQPSSRTAGCGRACGAVGPSCPCSATTAGRAGLRSLRKRERRSGSRERRPRDPDRPVTDDGGGAADAAPPPFVLRGWRAVARHPRPRFVEPARPSEGRRAFVRSRRHADRRGRWADRLRPQPRPAAGSSSISWIVALEIDAARALDEVDDDARRRPRPPARTRRCSCRTTSPSACAATTG